MDNKHIQIIASLPEKGMKRVSAIEALGSSEENAPILMALALSEKGKCKTAYARQNKTALIFFGRQ